MTDPTTWPEVEGDIHIQDAPVVTLNAPDEAPTQGMSMAGFQQPPEAPRKTKVAVLGFTETWRQAPFNNPEWEIWGLNELYMYVPRADRWFEIHKPSLFTTDQGRTTQHVETLRKMTIPIYMQEHYEDIPSSVKYPLGEVIARFGDYLTNSISYMIALAIMEGFKTIGVWGVDMAHDCIHPDMRVLTADQQLIRAGDLTVGQKLLAFDEYPPVVAGRVPEHRKYRRTEVESVSPITRPCYRLTMGDGTTLVSSEGHQWLMADNVSGFWRSTADLRIGDRIIQAAFTGAPEKPPVLPGNYATVVGTEFLGEIGVIGLQTGTKTLIVEGFASHNSEYGHQRPSCEYFIGWAKGAGIEVIVPPESDLCKTAFLYGWQEEDERAFTAKLKARKAEMEAKVTSLRQRQEALNAELNQYAGAMQDADHILKIWKGQHG